jgi:hypothetical protein
VTRFRLELLQWYALFAGPWIWATQHVLLFGATNAHCAVPVAAWNVPALWLELAISLICGAAVLAAEAAAWVVLRATKDADQYAPGPYGRMKFFAQAALVGNVLFLVIVTLDATGAVYHGCGGA